MSIMLYICNKNTDKPILSFENCKIISKALQPDNITYSSPQVIESNLTTGVLINPNDSIKQHATSVCLGCMLNAEATSWWLPTGPVPDGSYAMFRNNDQYLECLTDSVASRTIWYYFDDNLFLASTSQRAIVIVLNSFQLNREVIPWMLVTGTLGPGFSWDRRINSIKVDSSIVLDKESWLLSEKNNEIIFQNTHKSKKASKSDLKNVVKETLESIELDYSTWVLPLSGGHDSRSLLCLLKHDNKLKCITWGLQASLQEEKNDAYIAAKLAEYFGVEHEYLLTEQADEPLKDILHRFIVCGEGRTDQIAGYVDGFKIWKKLFDKGVDGVIRGDQAFGYVTVTSELDVRLSVDCPLLEDFCNLGFMLSSGIEKQKVPQWMERRNSESCAAYRDRLYQQYRQPYLLASLSDLKLSYVEICNPLLAKKIISVIRGLPDDSRTGKRLHREIIEEISPDIGFAELPAIGEVEDILRQNHFVDLIVDEFRHEYCITIFSKEFIDEIIGKIQVSAKSNSANYRQQLMKLAKKILPKKLKRKIMNLGVKPQLDFYVLAFRVYIICAMYKLLTDDADLLK